MNALGTSCRTLTSLSVKVLQLSFDVHIKEKHCAVLLVILEWLYLAVNQKSLVFFLVFPTLLPEPTNYGVISLSALTSDFQTKCTHNTHKIMLSG